MPTVMTDNDVAQLSVALVADARGAACPGPLLEAKKAMGRVGVGEVLELRSSDPQTKNDVAAWANKVGHAFLGTVTAQGYNRIFIRRAK